MCPGTLNAMCGDPWCHPAPAAEVLHAFLCLFARKQQYLSSDRKLVHLYYLSSSCTYTSRPSLFFPRITLSRSICTVFDDYSSLVIVAEMTNFLIVLLQAFINIFLKNLFFPQVSFVLLSLLIAVFRLNQ